MTILLYGEDRFLLENRLKKLKEKFHTNEDEFNYSVYDLSEHSFSSALEDAMTPPFLTDKKMVVVKNPLFLTSSKKLEEAEPDIKQLEGFISTNNPDTILVLYLVGKLDERKKAVKQVCSKMELDRVENLNDQQIFKVVLTNLKNRNTEIDRDACDLLVARCNNNLQRISNEVEKLSLYTNHITLDDVKKMVSVPIEEDVFSISKALLDKDTGACLKIYYDLIKTEEPIKLIALIASSLRALYQVKLLDRKGYNDDEIASMLSMNKYRLKYIRQDGKKYDINELIYLINELSHLDVKIKTGKLDRFKGLELFILKSGESQWR